MEEMKLIETQILGFWERNKVYQKMKEANKDKKKFYFLDGPPYATGSLHMGHALNKVMKDSYIRFFRMQGFNVWDQPGYDTHGLPIENKVEKEQNFTTKADIEKFGIANFINACKDFATRYISIMNRQFANMGVWMDWDNPYLTLDKSYIEGAWFTFKRAYEKGLLYKGKYSVHVCSHCETALAYNEVEHFTANDPSVYVKFAVHGQPGTSLLIWTTTPWTLFSNMGVMVHPNFDYAYVKTGDETLIIAKDLVEKVMKKSRIEKYKIERSVKGKELVGLKYDSPLARYLKTSQDISNAYKVVPSEQFVTVTDGTGLVHTAPGHGAEDFKVGQEFGLPAISPVGLDGKYTDEVPEFKGKYVKEADKEIMELLKSKNVLLHKETISHEYPKCWRCSTPLLQIAVPQWFFKVSAFRERLIEENRKIKWQPEWAGQRFENWLLSLGDWPVSRQRYWGIPLPIWECQECDSVKVVASAEELGADIEDLHRPYIDDVTAECSCGGTMKRIPDVLDVWFDSGVAPWASLGYPKKKQPFEEMFPVNLILEGPDQIRGWWNSLMITSLMTFDTKPFEKVIFHGFVLDAHGLKMSKSKGNVTNPDDVIEKYGKDILRYYLIASPPWDDYYFKWEDVDEYAKFFNIFLNTFRFLQTYGKDAKRTELLREDRWILAKLMELVNSTKRDFEELNAHKAVSSVGNFITNDLSRTYIKLIRERTWPGYKGDDKQAAYWTLNKVFMTLSKLLAPACPFITEEIYQMLKSDKDPLSVHMSEWPEIDEEFVDTDLVKDMQTATNVIEALAASRQEAQVNLRWPVKGATITGTDDTIARAKRMKDVICDLANVKDLEFVVEEEDYDAKLNYKLVGKKFGKDVKKLESEFSKLDKTMLKKELDKKDHVQVGDFKLSKEDIDFRVKSSEGTQFSGGHLKIDASEDKELSMERLYRELIRAVQEKRKEASLRVEESIEIYIESPKDFESFLEKHKDDFKRSVGAKIFTFKLEKGLEICGETEYKNHKLSFAFKKV